TATSRASAGCLSLLPLSTAGETILRNDGNQVTKSVPVCSLFGASALHSLHSSSRCLDCRTSKTGQARRRMYEYGYDHPRQSGHHWLGSCRLYRGDLCSACDG